jgi:N-acetylmuramoyl-L-alanine amidase
MSDEKHNLPPEENDEAAGGDGESNPPDLPASTIFVEMMRQAAARRSEPPPPPEVPSPRLPHVQRQPDLTAALFGENVVLPDSETSTPPVKPEAELKEPRPRPARRRPPETTFVPLPAEAPDTTAPAAPAEPVREKPPAPAPQPVAEAEDDIDEAADEAEDSGEDVPDEAMEEQRIRRIQRRKERRRSRRVGIAGGFIRSALVVLIAAGLASTIFTWFTAPDFIKPEVASNLQVAMSTGIYETQPTALPTPNWLRRVGIVSGHRGPENDPGAVCEDNGTVLVTEAEVNFAVAQIVVRNLRARGYSVDLLDEFDPRLDNYQAAALVSIHANTCKDWGERVSGFLVAKASSRPEGGLDTLLAECIARTYGDATALERRTNLTVDMTDYHSFREIHGLTPAAIIELGFLKDDREILTTRQDVLGQAITDGIICFLEPQDQPSGEAILATPGFIEATATATP